MSPADGAQWALIAICFIMIGALLTTGIVTIEQRAAVLAGLVAILLAVWRGRRRED